MDKATYISKNLQTVEKLVGLGDANPNILIQYNIYKVFCKYSTALPKMDRYSSTAEDLGTSERTVIRAIKAMKKQI